MQVLKDDDRFDIEIEAGEDFERVIQHKSGGVATNLEGYSGTCLVKTWKFGATILTIDVEITDGAQGMIKLTAPAADTELMGRSGVFALRLVKVGGRSLRPIWGRAHYSPGA